MIPIDLCGRAKRVSISSFVTAIDCGCGLDTGVIASLKPKVMH